MASGSNLTLADSLTSTEVEFRPQAGPLPSKRGEIGYREEEHREAEGERAEENMAEVLPARHPADRDAPPPVADDVTAPTQSVHPPNTTTSSTADTTDSSSTHTSGKRSLISFLKPKKLPHVCGIRFVTLFLFAFQLVFLGGTITAWVLSTRRLGRPNDSQTPEENHNTIPASSGSIFIHVVFGIAVLGQLLLLERRLFRLRAERYGYLHPGEMLPSHNRRRSSSIASIGFAPWNRPPLPTYAATLAASGFGTGDVEDHIIAAPAPPAYGNTRGSTLLLAGFLRESLRAQRPLSIHSQASSTSLPNERPLSYVSRDEEWEEICDAERARALEQTLARLEEGAPQPAVLRN